MKIPKVMSTQHPDNVLLPFFAESRDMSGDDKIQEAYYASSHLFGVLLRKDAGQASMTGKVI